MRVDIVYVSWIFPLHAGEVADPGGGGRGSQAVVVVCMMSTIPPAVWCLSSSRTLDFYLWLVGLRVAGFSARSLAGFHRV